MFWNTAFYIRSLVKLSFKYYNPPKWRNSEIENDKNFIKKPYITAQNTGVYSINADIVIT